MRTYRKRNTIRKRRPFRRYKRRTRIPRFRSNASRIYSFKRSCELDNFPINVGITPAVGSYYFSLSQLPQSSEFTALFDEYRIMAVRITFYPPTNTAWSVTGATSEPQPIGEFYTAIDYDSIPTPTGTNDLLQYQTCKRTWFNRPHTRYFKPRASQYGLVDGAASNTGYTSLSHKTWLDMATPTARYYGLLVIWANSNSSTVRQQLIRVTATYYIQCRLVR